MVWYARLSNWYVLRFYSCIKIYLNKKLLLIIFGVFKKKSSHIKCVILYIRRYYSCKVRRNPNKVFLKTFFGIISYGEDILWCEVVSSIIIVSIVSIIKSIILPVNLMENAYLSGSTAAKIEIVRILASSCAAKHPHLEE